MIGVIIVYLGLAAALLGGVLLLKPLSALGIRSRWQGGILIGCGLVISGIGLILPTGETRVAVAQWHLDRFVPIYQFHEVHSTRVSASKERVYRAIKDVTADEIMFFQTLTWIRRLGCPGPTSILNPPGQMPLLEVATSTGFLLLAEEPNREIVLGTVVRAPAGFQPKREPKPEDFKSIHEPGFGIAAMNFRVDDAGSGASLVTTETRVFATDASSRRGFARYWRVIYPGSALIRRMWLRAIRRRAEAQVS